MAVELLARGSPKGLGVCSRRGFSVVVAPQTPTRLRVSTAAPGKVSDCVRGAAERESRARDARSAGGVGKIIMKSRTMVEMVEVQDSPRRWLGSGAASRFSCGRYDLYTYAA